MCNPPFYGSREDIERSTEGKALPPNAACTGAEVEMITPGGEVSFVCQMVQESIRYASRCRWYTSMLGKMSSLVGVTQALTQHSIDNYAVTELVQGQTRRWAIAWSLMDIRLPDDINRLAKPNPSIQIHLPPRNTLHYIIHASLHALESQLSAVIDSVSEATSRPYKEVPKGYRCLIVYAPRNTWSRKARRAVKSQSSHSSTLVQELAFTDDPQTDRGLVCSITIHADIVDDQCKMTFQWAKGHDIVLFEGFCNHVSRKVQLGLQDNNNS